MIPCRTLANEVGGASPPGVDKKSGEGEQKRGDRMALGIVFFFLSFSKIRMTEYVKFTFNIAVFQLKLTKFACEGEGDTRNPHGSLGGASLGKFGSQLR